MIHATSEKHRKHVRLSVIPDEVADEECGADGDEDDGQVDLSARVGRLGTGAGQAGRSDATESTFPLFNIF